MSSVQPCEVPSSSLLNKYKDGHAFTDCYCIEVDGAVPLAIFVEAFYTTSLFKLERFLLTWLARRPSSDEQARALAAGEADTFAAWHVEDRRDNQLLVSAGRTRSWLMVESLANTEALPATRLYFGSAVVAKPNAPGANPELGFVFHALLGFHKLYSKALLRAAAARLILRRR